MTESLDETHPHHRKLRAIQEQTAVTRDLLTISVAFQIGLLTGADFDRARELVARKLAALLEGGR
jgi:hypothetical protein